MHYRRWSCWSCRTEIDYWNLAIQGEVMASRCVRNPRRYWRCMVWSCYLVHHNSYGISISQVTRSAVWYPAVDTNVWLSDNQSPPPSDGVYQFVISSINPLVSPRILCVGLSAIIRFPFRYQKIHSSQHISWTIRLGLFQKAMENKVVHKWGGKFRVGHYRKWALQSPIIP